jgi:Fanconi anemia group J protein
VSREAASLDATLIELEEAHHAFGRVVQYHNDVRSGPCVYSPLHSASGAVLQWLERQQVLTQNQGSYCERIWQGPPLLGELKAMGLTAEAVGALWEAYLAAREEDEASRNSRPLRTIKNKTTANLGDEQLDGKQQEGLPVLLRVGAAALGFMSRLIQIVRMLHEVSDDGGRDYRLVFRRQRIIRSSNSPNRRYKRRRSQREGEDGSGGGATVTISFSLWCLNPSIAFRQISDPAHSILLTSGTLAPLDSFASELGAAFPIRLEAPHVVNMRTQVWAGVVGQGVPGNAGTPLIATYQHADGCAFQDSLGLVVLEMCRCIPDGVLLFMPSYGMMEKVTLRWKATGLWLRLGQCKSQIVLEPRTGGADALGEAMGSYYGAVSTGGGALLIAVCRGKVSEGLDFTDENARGVLLVGIPFPNIKDSKVEAKRKFNDALSGSNHVNGATAVMPQLLSGSLWYEQQAFRALNQAIGRCIRHKGDWGAIVLVDDRFRQPRYQKGLSRWYVYCSLFVYVCMN